MTLLENATQTGKELSALILIGRGKHLTREQLEDNAIQILDKLTEAKTYLVETEQMYRFQIRELMEKEGLSFAAAENKAKTETTYGIYKKLKYLYEIGEERIRLLKLMLASAY